jgi:hypothetical protein
MGGWLFYSGDKMSILHSAIADADRHEAKGASTAVNKTVCMSNGDGTTTFRQVTYSDLLGLPSGSGVALSNSSFSTLTSQLPTAVDTPLQVVYGAGSVTTNVTIDNLGNITFNVAGTYEVRFNASLSRVAGAGLSILMLRGLLNTTQVSNTFGATLDNNGDVLPISKKFTVTVSPGDIFKVQVATSSAGLNVGGLYKVTATTAGWTDIPSASVEVYEIGS